MKSRKYRISKDFLFLTIYVYFLAMSIILGRSTMKTFLGMEAQSFLRYICYPTCALFLIASLLYDSQYTIREMLLAGFYVLIFLVSYINSGTGVYFLGILFAVASKGVDLKKIPKVTFCTQIVSVSLIVVLALSGQIENLTFYSTRVSEGGAIHFRQSLGFIHPNSLGAQFVQISNCWLWMRWDHWKWYHYGFFGLIFIASYTICNSQTSAIIVLLIAVLTLFFRATVRLSDKKTGVIYAVMGQFIWICPIVTFIACSLYDSNNLFIVLLDQFISRRISAARTFLRIYSVSILGSNKVLDENVLGADNVYANVIVKCGIIILILLIFSIYRLYAYARKEKMYPLMISLFVYAIYGLTEGYCYQLVYNFVLIYLSLIFFKKRNTRPETKKLLYERGKYGCIKLNHPSV